MLKGDCVWITHTFKHSSLHKYTRMPMGRDAVEVKSMINLGLVKKDMLPYVQNVRGMGRDHSDHHVVLCKVRLVRTWIKRREVKVSADKGKVMVLTGEEGLGCKVYMVRIRLEQVSELKYFGCVLNESGTDVVECRRKVMSVRKVAGVNRFLVDARDLQLESVLGCCVRHCLCLVCCETETMIWIERNVSD